MKKRQAEKKLRESKRFAKRPLKRITTTAVAAATVGTVAVAVTMTALEAEDYCEEKRELQEDANILYGTKTKFDYEQCYEDGKKDITDWLSQVKDSTVETVSNTWRYAAHYSAEKWTATKETFLQALKSTGEASVGLWDEARSWVME